MTGVTNSYKSSSKPKLKPKSHALSQFKVSILKGHFWISLHDFNHPLLARQKYQIFTHSLSSQLSHVPDAFMESKEHLGFLIVIWVLFLYPTKALQPSRGVKNGVGNHPNFISFLNRAISAPPQPNSDGSSTPPSLPLAPALFVIGDSTADCGTNNFLLTLARADRLPYGRDFDTHMPTGRFSNGRILVDYLALRLGLPFVPSYIGVGYSIDDMVRGVNYASAGAGIIFSSGSDLGQHISLSGQIQQVYDTIEQFILTIGEDAANDLISNSIFYVSIGTNDYIHYYLRNISNVQSLYLPWSFNQFLAQTLKRELKNLYVTNVRKVVVMGLPPIGCAPYYLWLYGSRNGRCNENINNMILEFNYAMRYIVKELNHELIGFNIIFCDAYDGSLHILKNYKQFGFTITAGACCGFGRYKGGLMCLSPEMACTNASDYLWWDQFHPTAAVNEILADNIWSSLHTNMCYPMNLKDMLAQKSKH